MKLLLPLLSVLVIAIPLMRAETVDSHDFSGGNRLIYFDTEVADLHSDQELDVSPQKLPVHVSVAHDQDFLDLGHRHNSHAALNTEATIVISEERRDTGEQGLHSSLSCNCDTCDSYYYIYSSLTVTVTCPSGYSVQVDDLRAKSRDGSIFTLTTYVDSAHTTYIPLLSTGSSSVTCFNYYGSTVNTGYDAIYVVIRNKNSFYSAPIDYIVGSYCTLGNNKEEDNASVYLETEVAQHAVNPTKYVSIESDEKSSAPLKGYTLSESCVLNQLPKVSLFPLENKWSVTGQTTSFDQGVQYCSFYKGCYFFTYGTTSSYGYGFSSNSTTSVMWTWDDASADWTTNPNSNQQFVLKYTCEGTWYDCTMRNCGTKTVCQYYDLSGDDNYHYDCYGYGSSSGSNALGVVY